MTAHSKHAAPQLTAAVANALGSATARADRARTLKPADAAKRRARTEAAILAAIGASDSNTATRLRELADEGVLDSRNVRMPDRPALRLYRRYGTQEPTTLPADVSRPHKRYASTEAAPCSKCNVRHRIWAKCFRRVA